jgi:LytS/YehU family sensor histidine kinase
LIQGTISLLFYAFHRLLGRERLARLGTWQRYLLYWGTPLLGLAIALPIASLLLDGPSSPKSGPRLETTPMGAVAFGFLVMALFYGFFTIRNRQLRAERQASEARLRLLQAQMEPHFLFNTLANVVGLMESDTPRAKAMLESFTEYLRASLLSLRTPDHALGVELDLIEAYLRVAKVRMEERLRYAIDVPDALRALRVPALSLQPLVENAVLHGLEPSVAGGTIHVTARQEGGKLVIRVADDGLGLRETPRGARPGTGTAIANIRERLRERYGSAAALQIAAVEPHGALATLTLPATGASA